MLYTSRKEAAMLPTVQGNILVYREGDQEGVLTIGTAAWFAWLETALTFSFVSDVAPSRPRKREPGASGAGWNGRPIANSTGSSPLATSASRRPRTLPAYRPVA